MPAVQHMGDVASSLLTAASDLIKAVESKDERAVAAALKAAFRELDKEPHEEGPHVESSEE